MTIAFQKESDSWTESSGSYHQSCSGRLSIENVLREVPVVQRKAVIFKFEEFKNSPSICSEEIPKSVFLIAASTPLRLKCSTILKLKGVRLPRITDQQKGLMSFQRECVRPCSVSLFMLSVSKNLSEACHQW